MVSIRALIPPAGRPAGGVLVVSCASSDELQASKTPAVNAAINIIFVDFINFVWLLFSFTPPRFRERRDTRSDASNGGRLQPAQNFGRRFDGIFNVHRRMCGGNKSRLELRRC